MLIIFGNIYTEITVPVDHLPGEGDVVIGGDHVMRPGGKGANQALAAGRAEAKAAFIGMIGDDDDGRLATRCLRRAGVSVSGVGVADDQATGIAFIMRGADGARRTIVCPGANQKVASDQVPDEILNASAYVLVQTEAPQDETLALLHRARDNGATTIINLSPVSGFSAAMLKDVDYIVLNHGEAQQLCRQTGLACHESNAARMAYAIAAASNSVCIITCSARGSVAIRPEGTGWHVEAIALAAEQIVDTRGSGDAFAGTLAACLKNGVGLDRAMHYASAAGSLSCMHTGAIQAFAYWAEIESACANLAAPQAIAVE